MVESYTRWSYQTVAEAAKQLPDYFRIRRRQTEEVELVQICSYSGYVIRIVDGGSLARKDVEKSFHILDLLQDWELCREFKRNSPTYMALVNIEDEQRANLERLASYLEQQPETGGDIEFSMDDYVLEHSLDSAGEDDTTYMPDCGSGGCAIGHAPYAGITKRETESWPSYERRAFGSEVRDWCFNSRWEFVDNTPHGAAARIRTALSQGIPSDCWQQMNGTIGLSYSTIAQQLKVDETDPSPLDGGAR